MDAQDRPDLPTYCDWSGADKLEALGGPSHTLTECLDACMERDSCKFVSYFEDTGNCHMFKSCNYPSSPTGRTLYQKFYDSIWDDRKAKVKSNHDVLKGFLKECESEKREIALTGHSLGGSVSTWLAIALEEGAYGLPQIPVDRVITYGAPRLVLKSDSKRCPARLQKRSVAGLSRRGRMGCPRSPSIGLSPT